MLAAEITKAMSGVGDLTQTRDPPIQTKADKNTHVVKEKRRSRKAEEDGNLIDDREPISKQTFPDFVTLNNTVDTTATISPPKIDN